MEIILGKTAGFCEGIKLALNKTEKELINSNKIDCLGDLLHNDQVLNRLKQKGLNIISNIKEAKNKVIIRAHGVEKKVYDYAKQNGIEIVDCSCPKVLKIHKLAEELSNNGYYIILIGEALHAEVIGTFSFCKQGEVIENIENLKKRIEFLNEQKQIAVITQTTYNLQKFLEIEEYINNNIKKPIKIYNCICNATENRQKETIKIAKTVDYMVIIGGKKSSNTNKLYDISKKNCKRAIMVETVEELYDENLEGVNKIGVMAGASTPNESIDEVIKYLKERK